MNSYFDFYRIKDQLKAGRQSKYELQHRPAENVASPRGYGASGS